MLAVNDTVTSVPNVGSWLFWSVSKLNAVTSVSLPSLDDSATTDTTVDPVGPITALAWRGASAPVWNGVTWSLVMESNSGLSKRIIAVHTFKP